MYTAFNAESTRSAKYSDFTLMLGAIFLSILITGSVVLTTRLVLNLTGLN